jgi:uncharacterized protein with NRDE domain
MCTLIVLDRVVPDFPVIAGANRDEFLARPATLPRLLSAKPRIIGPRDEQAGGTWIGVGEGGMFAGLTNRPHAQGRDPSRRSRGEITLAALAGSGVEAVLGEIGKIPPGRYNGFHLFCAGPDGSGALVYGSEVESRRLEPGLHVITNRGVDLQGDAKDARIRSMLGSIDEIRTVDAAFERLEGALRDHGGENILERVCIHGSLYGTRSATLIALHASDPEKSRYLHAEGRSCETPWKEVSDLLMRVAGEPSAARRNP